MSLKGKIKIDRYEAELVDGEWVPIKHNGTYEESNRIAWHLAGCMRSGQDDGRTTAVAYVAEGIFLGAEAFVVDDLDLYFTPGSITANEVYNAGVEGGADSYIEFLSTINPPVSGTRQIRTVVLTGSGSNDNKAWTIVNLPTPCPQTSSEILQITYRVINDQSAIAALGNTNYYVSEFIFANNTFTSTLHDFFPLYPHILTIDSTAWGKGIPDNSIDFWQQVASNSSAAELYYSGLSREYTTQHGPQGVHETTLNLQLGDNNISTTSSIWCGYPIKALAFGNNRKFTSIGDLATGSSSVQNIFGRAADTGSLDRAPFLNSSIIATSAADVNLIDKGNWIEHRTDSYTLPYMYRINVVAGGNVGVSTYNIQRRRCTRWERNNVNWISYGIPFHHLALVNGETNVNHIDVTTADTRRHGQTCWHDNTLNASSSTEVNSTGVGDAGTTIQRYVYPELISWDYDGLTFMTLNDYNWTNLDTNSAQAQTFTEILQVSTDGLDVYVADASQGLYKIERDFNDFDTTNWTITKLNPPGITNTNSCRGVFHKGGTYWGGPGKLVAVNVVRGGSNYSVGDTVTVTGVNGTGATAEVGAVDADGAITFVTVTAQGSGYIEDHIQLYVSTGTGVGAQLDAIIGAGGDMWAIFNDTTDSAAYMAHMTHVGSNDYTSLNFDTTGDTITRTGGTDFLVDGFRPGQALIVRTAEDAGNTGRFTITAVTSTVITVSENLTTNATDTQAQLFGEKWEIMTETITDDSSSLTFADANPDTIVGNGTSFLTQGFREGMEIVVSGTASNNGTYTIANVTATTITVDSQDTLAAETVAGTLATLTDFTITNYTSGSPGPVNIIGLVMDQEHADDRFAILTPSTKYANDGVAGQAVGNWTWWSFANSTGTTAAGSTDFTAVAGNSNSFALAGEQIGTHCVGPLSDGDTWVVHGRAYNASARVDFGGTVLTSEGADVYWKYHPHRCKTGFDIGVVGNGTEGVNDLKSNRVAADFTSGTQDSIITKYMNDTVFDNTASYRPGYYSGNVGALHGQAGHGMYIARTNSNSSWGGGMLYTPNGNGIKSSEDALPYGFWEDYGWDGTRWVLDNAGARTTHAQSSFSGTSLNINATTGAIVGTGFASTDWAGDGFEAGDIITIASAEDATNNGSYVIESLSGTTLTVTPDALPAVTNAADTTATVVGNRAIIDGLALSFDDSGGTAPLVINEYYDAYVYDGLLNDNATSGSVDITAPYMATKEGTDFESSTIPNSDVGAVIDEPVTIHYKSAQRGGNSPEDGAYSFGFEPGVIGSWITFNAVDSLIFTEQQIPASTDFTFRFKVGASCSGLAIDAGVAPQALADDASSYTSASMDYNLRIVRDYLNNPTHDLYNIEIRNIGNGGVQYTENADRVVLIENQTHTSYDASPGTEGTFIGGFESATDNHAASDVITMNDGTVVTVDAVDGNGTVTQFTITTNSTKSSGNGQIGAVSSSAGATEIDFNTTGNIISRNAGGSFITDGFRIGMKIQVDGATTEANDGAYTIQSVTASQIVTEENLNTTETNTSATIDHAIVQTSSTGSGVNFALIPGADNLQAADVGNDEYALNRVGTTGNNLYWTLNGVEFYTHTGGPFNAQYNPCFNNIATEQVNAYDAYLTHTIDRRYLKVGNGTTTGAFDNNFRCLPTLFAGTERLRLYIDGTEATYVLDGKTAPAAGEITILPYSGVLWFNTADAGKTLTGNWTTTLRLNIQ